MHLAQRTFLACLGLLDRSDAKTPPDLLACLLACLLVCLLSAAAAAAGAEGCCAAAAGVGAAESPKEETEAVEAVGEEGAEEEGVDPEEEGEAVVADAWVARVARATFAATLLRDWDLRRSRRRWEP